MNPVIDRFGIKRWLNEGGRPHRTDGPAVEYAGYHQNGLRHRTKEWFLNGKRHRTDGPAIEHADGYKAWYLNGARHRADGPAIEYADGSKSWFLNGVEHRTDGPAVESADGYKEWFLNGTKISEDLFLKLTLGPVKKLPLYLGLGFNQFISERLQHESDQLLEDL